MAPAPNPARALLAELAGLFPGAALVDPATVEQASPAAGAYLLALHLPAPVAVTRPAPGGTLAAGCYLYAGSARGPGGLRARLRRHLRTDKALHWHVDALTLVANAMAALALPGGFECAIVETLLATRRFTPAMSGFGSSDCPRCPAHLLHPEV